MKKPIKMVVLLLSLPLVLAGCKGNNNQVVENDLPEQEIEENVISDNKYGYSLVGVDRIKGFDEWIWNEFYFK